MELDIAGRRWQVTDHSTYSNAEGYHVDEWECEPVKGRSDSGYLLRETGDEVRWYFTRPVPISAVALQDGTPLADVAASLAQPPRALVYRGLAHGLAETTEGQYTEDPGASVRKTTWDYWVGYLEAIFRGRRGLIAALGAPRVVARTSGHRRSG